MIYQLNIWYLFRRNFGNEKKLQNVVKEAFAVCLAAFCVSLFFYIAFLILKKKISLLNNIDTFLNLLTR